MEIIKKVLVILSILIFVFHVEVLLLIYKGAKTDYYIFLDYYYAKERVNEFLISLMFFVLCLLSKSRIIFSMCIFGFTVSFSSMIDKVFLGNFYYLYSDIIIISLAFYLSYKTYVNGKNTSGTKRFTDKNNNS